MKKSKAFSEGSGTRCFKGIPASPGIAIGPVRRLEDPDGDVLELSLTEDQIEPEIKRFRRALREAKKEISELRETTRRDLDEETARIFDVQLLVLEDPLAVDRTENAIRKENKNAEFLFRRHMLEVRDSLAALADSYFSDRAIDLMDVNRRVLRHLSGTVRSGDNSLQGVLLGKELAPSEAVMLDPDRVLGLVTDTGGPTSHAAIMARARGIPAVVGVKGISRAVKDGTLIAVDGFLGTVEIDPTARTQERLRKQQEAYREQEKRHAELATLAAETPDGHRVKLAANMELPEEMTSILSHRADGVGLFRTEFFFMRFHRAPTEEEQFRVYGEAVRKAGPEGVTIRVLDLGGDKTASYLGMAKERSSFTGIRGIRYLVEHPKLFRTQLRAILRAGALGKARILFPMLSSVKEFETVRSHTRKALVSLQKEKVDFDPDLEMGVMIEVPAAVMLADELASEVDFFSVGSNDLIQYMLAVDRDNEALQHLYQPFHPAVLRALKKTVDAGHRHGKPVSICGEMAGDPLAVPVLVGLGFDQLSVGSSLLPKIKKAIRLIPYGDCVEIAHRALDGNDARSTLEELKSRLGPDFPDSKPKPGSGNRGKT